MNRIALPVLYALFAFTCGFYGLGQAQEGKPSFEAVNLVTSEGTKLQAAYFKGNGRQATIFVPGMIYGKESWFALAKPLRQAGVSSLCLDGRSRSAVLSAIRFLAEKGYSKIALVGGSMGGTAVMEAVEPKADERVNKLIVLAPYGGQPVRNSAFDKLFLYAKEDGFGTSAIKANFQDSSEPKKMVEYEGSDHAQALLLGKHKEAASKLIVDFILKGN